MLQPLEEITSAESALSSAKLRIVRNFALDKADSALVISSSGCNIVPIEMAEQFQKQGVRVVAIISSAHGEATRSKRGDGKKLQDFSDLVLDTGAPAGDA